MKITKIATMIMVLFASTAIAHAQLQDIMIGSMANLDGVRFGVVFEPNELGDAGLRDVLTKALSDQLSKSGIKQLTAEDIIKDFGGAMPYLQITMSMMPNKDGSNYGYRVGAELTQMVQLTRKNPSDRASVPTITWRDEVLWAGSPSDGKEMASHAMRLMKDFCDGYVKANANK